MGGRVWISEWSVSMGVEWRGYQSGKCGCGWVQGDVGGCGWAGVGGCGLVSVVVGECE